MYNCVMKELSKNLIASSLAPLVLLILRRQKSYGYEIIQQLKEKTGNKLDIAEGTLYPLLKKMEEKEWIESKWLKAENGRERKYYFITEKGEKELQSQKNQWDTITNIMNQLWKPSLT